MLQLSKYALITKLLAKMVKSKHDGFQMINIVLIKINGRNVLSNLYIIEFVIIFLLGECMRIWL